MTHKFSVNVHATWKLQATIDWHVASSLLSTHESYVPPYEIQMTGFLYPWYNDQQHCSSYSKDFLLHICVVVLYDCAVGFILMCVLYCDEMHQKVVLKNYFFVVESHIFSWHDLLWILLNLRWGYHIGSLFATILVLSNLVSLMHSENDTNTSWEETKLKYIYRCTSE